MTANLPDALAVVDQRFTSGNSVAVERASITAAEWSEIKAAVHANRGVDEEVAKRVLEDYWRVQGGSMVNKYFSREQIALMQDLLTRALTPAKESNRD